MKKSRLWLWIMVVIVAVALAIFCEVARGYDGSSVHYSPYALSRYGSGLVANNMNYSPYALNYHSSGLVPDNNINSGNVVITGLWPCKPSTSRGGRGIAVFRSSAGKSSPKVQKFQSLPKIQKPLVAPQPQSKSPSRPALRK
ncbi:MAG: hypothetical protein A3C48_00400 [Candidatus Nealsonbacteria bacterium RIFCSPHIGHO2_02_FULL_38_75]|nr:MAG: hypothetical protein US88_C0013G0013 [Parcubacteria group bacterium GW2011_GWA2_38_27]KKQ96995.1 MAG: hypothetical protein UT22_C0019G0013 [Parcubacteria group bacterium GW2011_GWC2_39_11]OGZ22184.1 MAG: hypothetical protein A3C48_00400 [Candidatus Nealsonbacteria bacterium RIFCSPHIGHO2_02_FULL_38_75]